MRKNMIKRTIYVLVALFGVLAWLTSCRQDSIPSPPTEAREGYVTLRFHADIPVMSEVVTRSVDPDGNGVQNMTLFCFDAYGLFITTATATIVAVDEESGSFSAEVPENTRTIHFLANQNMTEFQEDDFRNRSESEVMAVLEGSSGRMIYWARFACNAADDSSIRAQLEADGGSITLIRNHARISIDNPVNEWLVVTGFEVYNTNAFGTVAPYHPETGFDFVWPSNDSPFVTLPINQAKMSDISEVSTSDEQYIFENENRADDPVSVIVRGHLPTESESEDRYYRVMLLDDQGEQLLIRRNFHYKLHIKGTLSFGQPTFEAATTAAATNNVWISISDNVNEVEDQNYVLTVAQTNYVLGEDDADGIYTLRYTLQGKNGTQITDSDIPSVSWLDDNRVASPGVGNTFHVVDGVGDGQIQISLLPLGNNEKLEGTLLVKKGRLQRKIKIIVIKEQQFTPSWVGTRVWGVIDDDNPTQNRAHVTVMFTIPENCPSELFPLRVLVSTNELDIRSAAGVSLPVITSGEEGYGEPNGIGYKYVYQVNEPGIQRIYFQNVLSQEDNATGTIRLEAEHFETLDKIFTFSENQYTITVENLMSYNVGEEGGSTGNEPGADTAPLDEDIYYRLVPQKRSANVQFDMIMKDNADGSNFNVGTQDEFLLYSQHLDYYKDGEESLAGVEEFDCTFYSVDESTWSTGGRVQMFMPRYPDNPKDTGHYSIYMKTNCAKSAEVVRIASNQTGSAAVLPANGDSDGNYIGNSYRSVTFELANYRPFRFTAGVNGEGASVVQGTAEEDVTPLTWSYVPSQQVNLELDVTSFRGSDGHSVDPFGESFEIYIDAPMLEIDRARLSACHLNGQKLKADPDVAGRFIYTVDPDRDTERQYGMGPALAGDASGADQSGERKLLPFRTSSVVSAGDIVISANEEKVVFYAKTFRVSNSSITGSLKYRDASGTEELVPRNAFVSFERTRNYSRIGSMTVVSSGRYELRLRKEYEFNWYTDEVELQYEDDNGVVYHRIYSSLAELFASPDIVLEPLDNP